MTVQFQKYPSEVPKFAITLFADVEGYSRLMDENELDTVERVTRSINLVKDLIADYGGTVVNISGDGILAVFDDADRAVDFSVEMQSEFAKENTWNTLSAPIKFRIGIAAGFTYLRDNVLHGNSVNQAARIQELAEPGGIFVTEKVLEALTKKESFFIESLGRKILRNISEAVEIYSVIGRLSENSPVVPLRSELEFIKQVAADSDEDCTDLSIAILPLDNLSDERADSHLCNGIVADIISNLTRFRKLRVTARRSSFAVAAYTNSLREIGRRLDVRYLVTGGLRRSGKKLRMNVELIECESENTIWSEQYDGSIDDVFAFEDDVAKTTATRLVIQIDMAEQQRLGNRRRPKLDAYGLILRGEELGYRFRPESNSHARRLFMQARDLDPSYGRTYAAISRTFNVDWRYNWAVDRDAALDRALQLARDAVEYDSLDARGYSEMGFANLYRKQHDEALSAYERALELNPNDADLLAEMGDCLVYVGQAERSVKLLNRAIKLNPYHPDTYLLYLGDAYFHLADYEQTITTLLGMHDQSEGQRLMASSYALLGDLKKARYHANQVMKVHPNFTIDDWRQVPPNKYPEDLEKFVHGLKLSGLS